VVTLQPHLVWEIVTASTCLMKGGGLSREEWQLLKQKSGKGCFSTSVTGSAAVPEHHPNGSSDGIFCDPNLIWDMA